LYTEASDELTPILFDKNFSSYYKYRDWHLHVAAVVGMAQMV